MIIQVLMLLESVHLVSEVIKFRSSYPLLVQDLDLPQVWRIPVIKTPPLTYQHLFS